MSNWKGEELQPRETELMSVLERALPRTRVVKDLAQQMDQQYSTAAASFPGLIETLDLLSPVYDLQIGSLE